MPGASKRGEDIVRTAWRHAEASRNDLPGSEYSELVTDCRSLSGVGGAGLRESVLSTRGPGWIHL